MQGNGIIPIPKEMQSPELGQLNNVQLMYAIVKEMKEIPELESEKPTDTNALVKVEFPQEGGILTYMSAHEYPYRGFPYMDFVEKIDTFKKMSRGMLSGLYHSLRQGNRLRVLLAIPALFITKDVVSAGLYTYYKLIERLRVKSNLYSKAIRELYRAFDEPRKEDLKTLELRMILKDIVCMILEFDNAYRYRFQDIIVELDQKAVQKNPIKEFLRLLDVMSQRENDQKVKDTWKLFKLVVRFYLRFDRKLIRMLVDVFSKLDLREIAFMPEDKHFSCQRSDYRFGFMENPTPEDKKLIDRCILMRTHNEKRTKLDQELILELQAQQTEHVKEQIRVINPTPEFQKKLQEEIAATQKELMERHIAAEKEIPLKYLTEDQKDLLKKQDEARIELLNQHDLRRSQLAASYGL